MIEGEKLYYSDQCFSELCDQLQEKRLKHWVYSGETELLILQNNPKAKEGSSVIDFSNYVYIDLLEGIRKGYIDSYPRFMESLRNACKKEVEAAKAIDAVNYGRIKPRCIVESTLEALNISKPVKKVLQDQVFYKTSKRKVKD